MLSLNQILNKLEGFFNDHAQVNEVVVASDFDFNAERNLTYPVVNLEHVDSNISDKKMNHRFKVVVADILSTDTKNHDNEIVSDSLLIAEDFFSWLQEQEGFEFTKSTNIQRFVEDGGDRTAGVTFVVTLSTIRAQNTCQKPTR